MMGKGMPAADELRKLTADIAAAVREAAMDFVAAFNGSQRT